MQLGQLHPKTTAHRENAHKAHILDTWENRKPKIQPMIEPLSPRQQTVLSHRVSPELQNQLRSGFSSPGNAGRSQQRFSFIESRIAPEPHTRFESTIRAKTTHTFPQLF